MRRPSLSRRFAWAGAVWLLAAGAAAAPADTAPAPPAIYRKYLAPLLQAAESLPEDSQAALLLDETLYWVGADGRLYRVLHRVFRPAASPWVVDLPAAGTAQLVLARQRPAGGLWRSGEAALERAGAELRVSFPGLGAGDLGEAALLIEESLPIAGEFTALLTFYGETPTLLSRSLVELPAPLAARLNETPVGAAPALVRRELKDGRVRCEWLAAPPPPGRRAAVWLTTLASWDRLADWYRDRLAELPALPAALATAARSWTAAARGPREVAAILQRRLAKDLEAAPSELGALPALPRPPGEVFFSGRASSLDHANLLRALLADQGIEASLALVSSRPGGAIETRSPDFRHFDEALLAIENTGDQRGGYLFVDPQASGLEVGQVGQGAGDRQAFLLPPEGGWRFTRTPPASPPPGPAEPAAAPPIATRQDDEKNEVAASLPAPPAEASAIAPITPMAPPAPPVTGAEVDSVAEAALRSLEAGREEEALQALRRLAELGDEALNLSASPQQTRALRDLAEDESAARRAWRSASLWWPSWLELAAKIGLDNDVAPVPLLGDLQQLGEAFGRLLGRGDDREAFALLRRLAHAARWDPQLALELSGSLIYLGSARPDLAEALHQTSIILHRALPPFADPEAAARSRLLLAAHLVDGGRPAEAIEPLRDLLALKVGGLLERRGLTLLAMVALQVGEGQEQAADALARSLDETFPRELRGTAAGHLAELYHRLGRPREEQALLEREVAHPAIAGSPQQAELAARLAASRRGSDLLAEAFGDWRKRFPLPILELAEPASLADPRLQGKERKAEGASLLEDDWLAPEKVKIAFLLAEDARRPQPERLTELIAVLPELRLLLPRQSGYRAMLLALFEDRRFPAPLRSAAAFWVAYSLLQHENLAAADTFLARGDLGLMPRQRELLNGTRALLAAKKAGPAALGIYLEKLLQNEMTAVEAQLFPQAWRSFVLLGEAGSAEGLAAQLDQLGIAGGDATEEAELRRFARGQWAELAAIAELRRELRRRFLPAGPPPARPPLADEIASADGLEALPPEACRALLLHDLESLELGLAATSRWPAAFAACQDNDEEGGRRQRDLAFVVAESRLADGAKAAALASTAGYLSDDDPAWPSLLEGLPGRIDAAREPRTARLLRLLSAQRALRAGSAVDWRQLAEGLEDGEPWLEVIASWQARGLLRRGDAAAARSFLETLSPARLASPVGLLERLALLRLAPGPEGPKVVAAARRRLYLAQLAGLALASWSEGRMAIRLAEALELPYSSAWLAALQEGNENPLGRLSLELADAEARRDWPAAYAAANAMIAAENPDHDDLWNLGRAAFFAGKKEEAQVALRLFLERVKDHPEENEARDLLARLARGEP